MKEPTTIGLGEAMERLRDGLPVETQCIQDGWTQCRFNAGQLQWRGHATELWRACENLAEWSFRIPADPEPEVVKPVVVKWPVDEPGLIFNRENTPEAKGDCVLTIRPKSQQAERDRLEREFVERCENCFSADPKIRAYADFLKKEMA